MVKQPFLKVLEWHFVWCTLPFFLYYVWRIDFNSPYSVMLIPFAAIAAVVNAVFCAAQWYFIGCLFSLGQTRPKPSPETPENSPEPPHASCPRTSV
ncbi:MAG TPA: hypothetical protein VE621_17585 [Bryobacteraceae bacterium]|nr:hypothetical protein [Bryobacteraceae bacterium]